MSATATIIPAISLVWRTGAKSLSNVVTVIKREWLTWMKQGPKVIGGRKSPTTDRGLEKEGFPRGKRRSDSDLEAKASYPRNSAYGWQELR